MISSAPLKYCDSISRLVTCSATYYMNTLLINTASRSPGIALYAADKIVAEASWEGRHDESDRLLPALQTLLKDKGFTKEQVHRLACVVGPGGFTSVRIGVSAVNAWAYAACLEVAEVTLFDLYPTDLWTFVVANKSEAWVRIPDADPLFVALADLDLPDSFTFCGELSDDWIGILTAAGGEFFEDSMALPDVSHLIFEEQNATPWYYKDANITWSKKISNTKADE
jgi:tRNA threonylcarbamoyl adenosine modification protein YeaZ